MTTVANAFSTPPDFADGIRESLAVAAKEITRSLEERLGETWLLLHGSTVAENAIADGRLDPVGLVTTSGFRDTLFATRGGFGRWSGLSEDEKRNPVETVKAPAACFGRSHPHGYGARRSRRERLCERGTPSGRSAIR